MRSKIFFEDISGKICQNFGKKCPVMLFPGEFFGSAQNISKNKEKKKVDSPELLGTAAIDEDSTLIHSLFVFPQRLLPFVFLVIASS